MPVNFIFKLIFDSSGRNNNRLPHHEGEKTCQKWTAYNNSYIDKNLMIEAKISIFCKFIHRFSYKLNFIYIKKITGNDE